MRAIVFIVLPLLFLGTPSLFADKLRIATAGGHPPFSMKDSNGQLTGFDVDLARALCFVMQASCSFQAVDATELLEDLQANKFDAVISTVTVSSLENDRISYTDPYYSKFLRYIVNVDDELDIHDLAGKKLGGVQKSPAARHLAEQFSDAAEIQVFANSDMALQALKDDKLDAVLVDAHTGYNWLAQVENMGYDFVGDAIDAQQKSRIAIRKEDVSLQTRFNDALKTLLEQGAFRHISRNYFPFDIN